MQSQIFRLHTLILFYKNKVYKNVKVKIVLKMMNIWKLKHLIDFLPRKHVILLFDFSYNGVT